MSAPFNPFILSPHTPVRYFCDRKTETDEIIKYLENGSNITLISPRRLGKTGLIYHIFDVLEERDADYETYYIDIYPSHSFEDFLALTAEAIYTKTAGYPEVFPSGFVHRSRNRQGSVLIYIPD